MNKLSVVMYHYTRDLKNSEYPEIKGLDYGLFEQQLQFFQSNFTVVTMEQVLESRYGGANLPDHALLLTFDDGYIDNFTVAFPLLHKYGFQGSFFISGRTIAENIVLDVNKIQFIMAAADVEDLKSQLFQSIAYYRSQGIDIPADDVLLQQYAKKNRYDNGDVVFVKKMLQTGLPETVRNEIVNTFFEKYVGCKESIFSKKLYMNRDQIKCMKDYGMYIGVHGYNHYWLADLSQKAMMEDVDKGIEAVKDYIEEEAWVMNYPYGSYRKEVIEYIKKRGCVLGLTIEPRIADFEKDNVYTVPRLDCNDFPPKSKNYKLMES